MKKTCMSGKDAQRTAHTVHTKRPLKIYVKRLPKSNTNIATGHLPPPLRVLARQRGLTLVRSERLIHELHLGIRVAWTMLYFMLKVNARIVSFQISPASRFCQHLRLDIWEAFFFSSTGTCFHPRCARPPRAGAFEPTVPCSIAPPSLKTRPRERGYIFFERPSNHLSFRVHQGPLYNRILSCPALSCRVVS